MRLSLSFRYAIYAAFAVLLLTGCGWLLADWEKDISSDEIWQQSIAYLLMVHGGTAMAALLLIGALVPVHLARAWRARKNRISGSAMATFIAILIGTAFGLYYLGSESLRPWMSWIHIAAGVSIALLFPLHIYLGRRKSA
ncbi:hypothetical protein [Bradyrhizobium sp.]|uniref:hypothetical protein n=1 Tax=Bradyrhizobium sp. TaxID=376 RepID=UPI002D48DB1F|nr:hypothetical protein [Bradyrhizobium sp.]HZR74887.1 hypothetical protein [Bradyrhizobium sp.]